MRVLSSLAVAALLLIALPGCSSKKAVTQVPEAPLQQEAMNNLEAGRVKAALSAAEQFTRESPGDYQSWLTLNAVHLVMRDYQAAHADNARAMEAFEASADKYPENERRYRRARIEESFALTALIASRRAETAEEHASMAAQYEKHAAILKELDEDAWNNLKALAGEPPAK